MEKIHHKVRRILDERAKRRKKISITIDENQLFTLKFLTKYHKVSLSALIEACIEIGLDDDYIAPKDMQNKIEDEEDLD